MEIKLKALELPDLEKYSFPLYNRVRACLEDFYLNNSSYGYSNSDLIALIQELYFRSTYEALLNVIDSVNNSLSLDDMSVVINTLYSIKGTKEAIEYIYSTVLGSDTDVVYDPTTRELSITHISLDILDLEKFNKYSRILIGDLILYSELTIVVEHLLLNIEIDSTIEYSIGQQLYYDFTVEV